MFLNSIVILRCAHDDSFFKSSYNTPNHLSLVRECKYMDISIYLARVIGLYLIIISLSILINPTRFTTMIKNIIDSPTTMFLLGLNILIWGLLLVVAHNIWEASWAVLITIIAWITLLKGIFNFAFPEIMMNITQPFLTSRLWLRLTILIDFVLGLILCYYGFFSP